MKMDNKIFAFFKNKSKILTTWSAVFLFFFLSFWSNWKMSFLHASFITICLWFTSDIESKYIVKLLQRGYHILFYLINFLVIIAMSVLTTYLESFMLIIMSKHLSMTPPALEGVQAFFIPTTIRVVLFTATVAISVISVIQNTEKESQRIKNELKSEKLDMELRLLKSQITPHFLFNALNNIYSLVYTKDDNAPQSVLKLSDMLRYVMVDCQVDMISLEKEIKYIDAFIDFQKMSMENKSNVIFEKQIENKDFKIPPMILQPLVENSFKHSRLVSDSNGFVHFYLIQEKNDLVFIARNSIKGMSLSIADSNKKPQSGIGLENVKKRLSLYYVNNYSFEAVQEDNKYVVTIKIGDKFNEKDV